MFNSRVCMCVCLCRRFNIGKIISKWRLRVYDLVYHWDPFQKSLVMLANFQEGERSKKREVRAGIKDGIGGGRRGRERQREKEAVGQINSRVFFFSTVMMKYGVSRSGA